MTTRVTRADLQSLSGISPKLIQFFEQLFATSVANSESIEGQASATGAIQDATVLTLSTNAAFSNERVLGLDPDLFTVRDEGPGGRLFVTLLAGIATNGGYRLTFNLLADTNLSLPPEGRVLESKVTPADYADDAAAAAAGVQVGEIYRKTGGTVAWRVA